MSFHYIRHAFACAALTARDAAFFTVYESTVGVLVKKIGDDSTAVPTTQSTQSSPEPVAGLIAGLGIAGILLRMRR